MSYGIRVLVRAVLFLLFTIALAVATPAQSQASQLTVPRVNTAEIPPETNEHRDNQQLRERRNATPMSRRCRNFGIGPRALLFWWQPFEWFRWLGHRAARYPGDPVDMDAVDDSARSRHAPASLQVFRR